MSILTRTGVSVQWAVCISVTDSVETVVGVPALDRPGRPGYPPPPVRRTVAASRGRHGGRRVSVPSPEDSLRRVWSAVAAALGDGSGGTGALAQVGEVCTLLLPVDGVSISVVGGARTRETMYAGDEVSDRIQRLQWSLGEGPSFEAHETRRPILVPDLAADTGSRWPVFATEIGAFPVGAVFAFPLQRGAIGIGGWTCTGATRDGCRPRT